MLPSLLAILGAPAYALGLIEGLSDGISNFAKLLSGYYSDKFGKRKEIAIIGYLATGIFPIFVALASSWPIVLVARSLGWFGRGIRGPPKDAILSNSVEEKDLGKAFGFHRMADTLGAILGPFIGFLLVSSMDLRSIFLLTVIPGTLAAVVFWIFVKEDKTKINTKIPSKRGFKVSFSDLPKKFKKFLYSVGIFGMADFSHTLLIFFVVSQLTPSLGFIQATASSIFLFGIRSIAYALMCYPFGLLGDRVGKQKMLTIGYAIAVITFIGFILAPVDIIAYSLLFILAGTFIAAEDTLEGAVVGSHIEKERRTLGYGALATVNGIGDLVSSLIVGALWTISFNYGIIYSAFVGAMGTISLLLINDKDK